MSLENEFKKALAAAKRKRHAKHAITRYGYLTVRWPLIEDDFSQSGGGAVFLGRESELSISRSDSPKAIASKENNLLALRKDAKRILGTRARLTIKDGNLFLQSR